MLEHFEKEMKEAIQHHVDTGGLVIFRTYGVGDAKDPTGLEQGCGCALSIATVAKAKILYPVGRFGVYSFFNTDIGPTLKISEPDADAFIEGFDKGEKKLGSNYEPSSHYYWNVGVKVRNWVRSTFKEKTLPSGRSGWGKLEE